jgi:hypothetical protein
MATFNNGWYLDSVKVEGCQVTKQNKKQNKTLSTSCNRINNASSAAGSHIAQMINKMPEFAPSKRHVFNGELYSTDDRMLAFQWSATHANGPFSLVHIVKLKYAVVIMDVRSTESWKATITMKNKPVNNANSALDAVNVATLLLL